MFDPVNPVADLSFEDAVLEEVIPVTSMVFYGRGHKYDFCSIESVSWKCFSKFANDKS